VGNKAIILAGGKGTRLKPYSIVLPKPLVPIHEYPILELIIRQLKRSNFTDITIAVNHLSELIMAYFGDGSKWGVEIDYSQEDKPLSTMGPLRLIKNLPDNFLVMNGDVLTDLDLVAFYNDHVQSGANFTIASHRRTLKSEYGVIDVDASKHMVGFREKPEMHFLVSMGVYLVNRRIVSLIPEGVPFGFDHLMLKLLDMGEPASVYAYDGYWLDIGRPDDYSTAFDDFERIKKIFF
jgi:NDP-sugar pyrophosphorylase family protein